MIRPATGDGSRRRAEIGDAIVRTAREAVRCNPLCDPLSVGLIGAGVERLLRRGSRADRVGRDPDTAGSRIRSPP